MPEEKGTGKHPHKSTGEPWPHTKGKESEQSGGKGSGAARAREEEKGESSDLKEREYRDEQGNIHHHTKTYMEQHKGEQDKQ